MTEAEAETTSTEKEEEAEMAAMLDLSSKKKKKKKKKDSSSKSKSKSAQGEDDKDDEEAGEITVTSAAKKSGVDLTEQKRLLSELQALDHNSNNSVNSDNGDSKPSPERNADYTYPELLDRVMYILHSQNPDLIEKKRRNMKPPQLTRVGTKKTLWVNFQEICSMMQRSPEHVFQFFMAELGTEGSIDGNHRLVIRGKYLPKYIESLLKKYIVEYVTCQMCRSPNTDLTKDSGSRLYFCKCRDCGSSRSVAPIRSGYHATSRADRRAARAAKG